MESEITHTNLLIDTEIGALPPSVNAIWRSNGKGVYKTKETKVWQNAAIALIDADRRKRRIFKPYEGQTEVQLILYTKTARRMDIDNRVKATLDCLAPAGVIKDDSQIWRLNVRREISTIPYDYCRVILWKM